MAKKKAAKTEAAEAGHENNGAPQISKAEAVRAALAEKIDNPTEGSAFIKERYGLDVNPQMFSAYKSQGKKKAGESGAVRTRMKTPTADTSSLMLPTRPCDLGLAVESIKALCEQLGVDQVKRIAEVFR